MLFDVIIRRTLIIRRVLSVEGTSPDEAERLAYERTQGTVLAWAVDDGQHWEQEHDEIIVFDSKPRL
jgi:hypothetical protein